MKSLAHIITAPLLLLAFVLALFETSAARELHAPADYTFAMLCMFSAISLFFISKD